MNIKSLSRNKTDAGIYCLGFIPGVGWAAEGAAAQWNFFYQQLDDFCIESNRQCNFITEDPTDGQNYEQWLNQMGIIILIKNLNQND